MPLVSAKEVVMEGSDGTAGERRIVLEYAIFSVLVEYIWCCTCMQTYYIHTHRVSKF